MENTVTTNLDTLRHALLRLHKTLLDASASATEREHGRVESTGEHGSTWCCATRPSNGCACCRR